MKVYNYSEGDYLITTDKTKIDIDAVCNLLGNSYWACERKRDTIVKSIENSFTYSIFYKDTQIGFARVITDNATFAYLCDVIVNENYRGQGLGKWLMGCIMSNPGLGSAKWMLATKDAHELYRRYGFESIKSPEKYMIKQA